MFSLQPIITRIEDSSPEVGFFLDGTDIARVAAAMGGLPDFARIFRDTVGDVPCTGIVSELDEIDGEVRGDFVRFRRHRAFCKDVLHRPADRTAPERALVAVEALELAAQSNIGRVVLVSHSAALTAIAHWCRCSSKPLVVVGFKDKIAPKLAEAADAVVELGSSYVLRTKS